MTNDHIIHSGNQQNIVKEHHVTTVHEISNEHDRKHKMMRVFSIYLFHISISTIPCYQHFTLQI